MKQPTKPASYFKRNLTVLLATIACISSPASFALTTIEQSFLTKSNLQEKYPNEHFSVIETENAIELGKLTALSFIDWISENPKGVIALPTGKTPEYFIKFIAYYQQHWNDEGTQRELKQYGIALEEFPDTSNLKFVQLDEFYPISNKHPKSFSNYVKKYYLKPLKIKRENSLLMESLSSKNEKEAEDFVKAYEAKIKAWGGIGFFVGGIGYDGHIAFNLPGSKINSPTRIVKLNYPTRAQAASDLGGIEQTEGKQAATIGIGTLYINPKAKVIIMASGEAKAPMIQNAVERCPNSSYPATLLQDLPNAIIYSTHGAAKDLKARKLDKLNNTPNNSITTQQIDEIINEISLLTRKPILKLSKKDIMSSEFGRLLFYKLASQNDTPKLLEDIIQSSHNRLISKIENGLSIKSDINVLHTSPHHDDVMLSYYPIISELLEKNTNYFSYVTSGFNSVTDAYIQGLIKDIGIVWLKFNQNLIFKTPYQELLHGYKAAHHNNDKLKMKQLEQVIALKNILKIYNLNTLADLKTKLDGLQKHYFVAKHPGELDSTDIKLLKGAMRESEVDRLWSLNNISTNHIYHLRSKFYTDSQFNPLPTLEDDAKPIVKQLYTIKPELVTVALDPEGTGPDTHYKVLQAVAKGLEHYNSPNLTIWGYRNIWHRFNYSEANLFMPVNNSAFHEQHKAFMNCFSTQKNASFPSPQFNGPFSKIAQHNQADQLNDLKTLLGESYFENHPNPKISDAKGMILIKSMKLAEFLNEAHDLEKFAHLEGPYNNIAYS